MEPTQQDENDENGGGSSSPEDVSGLGKPDDVSLEDWMRCHLLPCEQWERMKRKMKVLKVLDSQASDEERQVVLDNLDHILQVRQAVLDNLDHIL